MKIKIKTKNEVPIIKSNKIKLNIKSNKIKLNIKSNKIKLNKTKNKKYCQICNQLMDLCITSHKNKPYIDNKCYSEICFTCYHVPKISYQKYDENGYIIEELDLEYSIKNIHKPEELFNSGSADSLEYAKKSVKAVKNLKIKQGKDKKRPPLEYYLINYEI